MTRSLAIIVTHPIQYYVPVFQLLAKQIQLRVFYTLGDSSLKKYDIGFKQKIEWDIPLLEGYDYEFLENIAQDKGSHHFKGINNPNGIERIKLFNPDAILIYGWSYSSHLKIIRHFKNKVPVYFRGDSTLLNQKNNFKSLLKKIFLNWVYKHVDFVFYVGTANKNYFRKYGLKDNQLIFAPHAVDNKRFGEIRKEAALAIRTNFSVKDDDILILFAGKFDVVKNPLLLLNAFANLAKKDVHLLFVGNGVLEEKLKAQVSLLEGKNVHFMNFQNQTQIPIIYQACDLFCLPSKSETWGLAVNEAMACGKAILVSDKVGCAQDLVNFENGAIFESENLIDLTQKLIALTNDKTTLEKMGEKSLEYIQKWSFEQQVKAIKSYANR